MASSTQDKEVENFPLSPIIFSSPDLKPDVRLKVFNQEFHVHSVILRLHSAYFRRFLDSPEKPDKALTVGGIFKYDYISIIDEDGGDWGLEPTSMVCLTFPFNSRALKWPAIVDSVEQCR
jgi:hypothetical protein